MADEYKKLTREELDVLAGEALPERAAMTWSTPMSPRR